MGGLRASQGFLGTIGQPSAQFIEGSLRFNGVNQHLTKTFSSGNRRTFTLSYWIKEHGKGSSPTNNPHILWSGTAVETRGGMVHRGTAGTDSGRIYMFNQVSNTTDSAVWTEGKFRDFGGWKHVVFRVDSTISSPSTNRVRIYINGVEQATEYKTTPAEDHQFQININQEHRIGRGIPDDYGNFSLSQYYFIDAQALGPEYFGFTDPLTNTWRPKKYEGTFGTTGFWLPFDGISPIGKDKSGNGNDWSPQNFSDSDILKDSPSGVVFGGPPTVGLGTTNSAPTNYSTLNPLVPHSGTLSDGNLSFAGGSAAWCKSVGTFQIPSSGKYYFEGIITGSGAASHGIGLAEDVAGSTESDLTTGDDYYCVVNNTSTTVNKVSNASATSLGSIGAFSQNDVFGVAVDGSTKEIWIHKNNTYFGSNTPSGTALLTGSGNLFPAIWGYNTDGSWDVNFGQKPFKYAPPDGFVPLTSAGITPEIVITDPTQYVGVTTYNGNAGTQAINVGMSPDFVWIKERGGSKDHNVYDTVRGVTKELFPNGTGAENTLTTGLTSFNDNGYTFSSADRANGSSRTYVNWFWKAGGNKNTFNVDDIGYSSASDAGLDGGTITPSGASVGTKQGFSIIKLTGTGANATFSHGLSQAPDYIICKADSSGPDWGIYERVLGSNKIMYFDNQAASSSTTAWQNTHPTDSLVYLGANGTTNQTSSMIYYIWHSVPGLQKFGSFTCNGDGSGGGDEDGPYVELGFRPAMILFKGDYNSDWFWIDDERCKINYNDVALRANYQYSEIGNDRGGVGSTSQPQNYAVDLLSNGFKIRASGGSLNSGTNTMTYAAWAKSPFSNLFGGQSNA